MNSTSDDHLPFLNYLLGSELHHLSIQTRNVFLNYLLGSEQKN